MNIEAANRNPTKVAVTGFSMGGRGSWQYAAKFPDRFTAAMPVAAQTATPAPITNDGTLLSVSAEAETTRGFTTG